jgi:hypothetical protein
MKQLSDFQTIIDKAISYAEEVDKKEAEADKAKNELRNIQNTAGNAWNELYTALVTMAEERFDLDDTAFKNSRLGYMLKEELQKAKNRR